jgi:hypothetical protein
MNAQSLVRRFLAVVSGALLAGTLAVAGSTAPANAAPRGSLDIVSVTDTASGFGAPVQDRDFSVRVRVLDTSGQPTIVSRATTIRLTEVSGPGTLSGNTDAVIPRNGSGATISGARYSTYANGVEFRVSVVSGVDLEPDQITVDVAATAVGANATPRNSLNVRDPNCVAPTADLPTCGSQLLLPNGANGRVTVWVGSCDGLADCRTVGDTTALVVTAIASLKDSDGDPLYNSTSPATLILACDKVLCGQSGVPRLPVIYTLSNDGDLNQEAPPCPEKGVLGEGQDLCVDYVQSTRSQGDLYTYILFDFDLRASHP